jgi:hypothetical protein
MSLWYAETRDYYCIREANFTSLYQRSYAAGSSERDALQAALKEMEANMPFEVPCIVNGKPVSNNLCSTELVS